MSVNDWLKKLIAWCVKNGEAGDADRKAVDGFMHKALQKCANTKYGNVVYREMCKYSDGDKAKVVNWTETYAGLGSASTKGYDTLVGVAMRLNEAEGFMRKLEE